MKRLSIFHYHDPLTRHPREGGDPAFFTTITFSVSWAPAFAGVTVLSAGRQTQ
jgi:hypothetical protein